MNEIIIVKIKKKDYAKNISILYENNMERIPGFSASLGCRYAYVPFKKSEYEKAVKYGFTGKVVRSKL